MDGRELKLYQRRLQESQHLRSENNFLRGDRDHYRKEWFFIQQRVNRVEERNEKLVAENRRLRQQNRELLCAAACASVTKEEDKPVAEWIKPPVVRRRRRKPGRKKGHPAALRPMPDHIDVHHDAPLPVDAAGRESCPHCSACLLDLEDRQRLVEDIVPAQVVVKCYHTRSGWCPSCRRQVESRAPEQPPPANLPHGQLGINALATAMLLRIHHRLPFRQVTRVFADLPELSISPGAIAQQVQRIARWLDGDYEKLVLQLRSSPHVHADETGWRTSGRHGYLWSASSPSLTVYHVDKSRAGKVIGNLLGRAFGGTLVSDFYSAYAKMDCKKQKCLVHLLRDLSESAEKSPAFASGAFFPQAKALIKQMLLLKSRWEKLTDRRYDAQVLQLEAKLQRLVSAEQVEAHARRLARRMARHQKELTAFLYDKDLQGTNNAAERALRPAVVARKISGGSRSKNGAKAWAVLCSLLRTADQQGKNLLETIKSMLIGAWAARQPTTMPTGP
jgi:transposase